MRWNYISLIALGSMLTACCTVKKNCCSATDPLRAFQERAAKFNSVVTLPVFETTTNEVAATADRGSA